MYYLSALVFFGIALLAQLHPFWCAVLLPVALALWYPSAAMWLWLAWQRAKCRWNGEDAFGNQLDGGDWASVHCISGGPCPTSLFWGRNSKYQVMGIVEEGTEWPDIHAARSKWLEYIETTMPPPPKPLHDLRVTVTVDASGTKETHDITTAILQLAGPARNFYSDAPWYRRVGDAVLLVDIARTLVPSQEENDDAYVLEVYYRGQKVSHFSESPSDGNCISLGANQLHCALAKYIQ